MTENTKRRYALIHQAIIQNGIETCSRYNRIVSDDGETLYCGVTDGGYLKSRTVFAGEGVRTDITCGPNRRFFSTSLVLRGSAGEVIAEIRYKRFNIVGFGNKTRNSVLDANGKVLLDLLPSEYFENNLKDFFLSRLSNELILKQGDAVLGYTGHRPAEEKLWAKALDKISASFAGAMREAISFGEKVAGISLEEQATDETRASSNTLAQDLALVGDGVTLDPRLVLLVLLFNEHFHSWRGVDGGTNQSVLRWNQGRLRTF